MTLGCCLCGCPRKKAAGPDRAVPDAAAGPPLTISALSFAGPAGHREDRNFSRGETVTCLFTVTGFTYREHKAHIRADIRVTGAGGMLALHQPDLVLLEGKAPTLVPGSIRSAATLTLSPAVPAGRYTVQLAVRDLLGRRHGRGEASFTILGTPPTPVKNLTLVDLRGAADLELPPGSALPVAFTVKGLAFAKASGGKRRAQLEITASIEDSAGQRLTNQTDTLLKTELTFEPAAYPLEHVTLLPGTLTPGPYRLALQVTDRIGGGRSSGLLRFQVVDRAFGIVNLHTHDAAGLPRHAFLLGEQIYVRLSVHGLKVDAAGQVNAAVDLAVAGPDRGVYLAHKNATTVSGEASKPVARAGRYPVQLPLILPALCPTGKYRLVIRARDNLARRETVRELPIQLQGSAPSPLTSFKVDQLEVRDRPDLPLSKGDTFGAGRTYHLALRLGGAKLKQRKKMIFEAKVVADLRLRDLSGKLVHERKELFRLERALTYRPLRIVIPAEWAVPAELKSGLYDLEISALDLYDDRVSQMRRRVEVVGAGPAVPVPLP